MIPLSFLRCIVFVVLLFPSILSSVLLSSEKDKEGLKQVYAQALKDRDLWTCLQIEAWQSEVFKEKVVTPVLGRSRIIGSPRLAFPDRIRWYWVCAERLIVVGEQSVWILAPEGWPLRPRILLPFRPDSCAVSSDGSVLACALRGTRNHSNVRIAILRTDTAEILWDDPVEGPITPQHYPGRMLVSGDGSVATVFLDGSTPKGFQLPTVILSGGSAGKRIREPLMKRLEIESRHWSLIRRNSGFSFHKKDNENGMHVQDWAPLPDGSIVLLRPSGDKTKEARLFLAKANAAEPVPLKLQTEFHSIHNIGSVGVHVVIWGDIVVARTDLFGAPLETPTLNRGFATFSMSTLQNETPPAAAISVSGEGIIDTATHAAILSYQGSDLLRLNLGETTPTWSRVATAANTILSVSQPGRLNHRTIVRLADQQVQIFDPAGNEYYLGPLKGDLSIDSRRTLVRRDSSEVELVSLSREKKQRTSVLLKADLPRNIHISTDLFDERVLAIEYGIETKWRRFSAQDGTLKDEGVGSPPQLWREGGEHGPFFVSHARLVPKTLNEESEGMAAYLAPKALVSNRDVAVVLDEHGFIFTSAKAGEPIVLVDRIVAAHGFGIAPNFSGVVVTKGRNDDRDAIGVLIFTAGKSLSISRSGPAIGRDAKPLPQGGDWKIHGLRFFLPNPHNRCIWTESLCGFRPSTVDNGPALVANPAGDMLYAFTQSVVLMLDPTNLSQVAKFER